MRNLLLFEWFFLYRYYIISLSLLPGFLLISNFYLHDLFWHGFLLLLLFILFDVLSASWIHRFVSFVKFGKFPAIISSNTFLSQPLPPLLPASATQMLGLLCWPHKFLSCWSFLLEPIFSHFWDCVISILLSCSLLLLSSDCPFSCWVHPWNCLFWLLYFKVLKLKFLYSF